MSAPAPSPRPGASVEWLKVRRGEPQRFDQLRKAAYVTVEGDPNRRTTTCYRCTDPLPYGDGYAVTVLCRGAYRGTTKFLCAWCVRLALVAHVAGDSITSARAR